MTMTKRYLEAGKIINTHGVHGELKIQPWADGPAFLKGFRTFYIDGKPFKILSGRVHKGCFLAVLEGIDTVELANGLRGKLVCIDRQEAHLEAGAYFLQDIIGLDAVDHETGEKIGVITDVMDMPSGSIIVIDAGREMLVPNVPEFVKAVDIENGVVKLKLIEGL